MVEITAVFALMLNNIMSGKESENTVSCGGKAFFVCFVKSFLLEEHKNIFNKYKLAAKLGQKGIFEMNQKFQKEINVKLIYFWKMKIKLIIIIPVIKILSSISVVKICLYL